MKKKKRSLKTVSAAREFKTKAKMPSGKSMTPTVSAAKTDLIKANVKPSQVDLIKSKDASKTKLKSSKSAEAKSFLKAKSAANYEKDRKIKKFLKKKKK